MPTASIFPKLLDTDTQLFRRTGTDAIVPEDHNNLVDGIQAVQATVGMTDDNTGNGGSKAFNSGLADYVNFPSTGLRSLRFPWVPAPTNAWYGRAGSVPAGWTLGAGVTADWTTVPGLCRLSFAGAAPQLMASCNVNGASLWETVFHIVPVTLYNDTTFKLDVGLSVNGLGTDIDGYRINATSYAAATTYLMGNGALLGGSPTVPQNNRDGGLWLAYDGANFNFATYAGLGLWIPHSSTSARAVTPTKLCLYLSAKAAGTALIYVDFIAQSDSAAYAW